MNETKYVDHSNTKTKLGQLLKENQELKGALKFTVQRVKGDYDAEVYNRTHKLLNP